MRNINTTLKLNQLVQYEVYVSTNLGSVKCVLHANTYLQAVRDMKYWLRDNTPANRSGYGFIHELTRMDKDAKFQDSGEYPKRSFRYTRKMHRGFWYEY